MQTIHWARAVGKTLILSVEKLLPPTHLCRCPPTLNHGHPLPAPVYSATAATAAVWRVRAILGHIVLIFRHVSRCRRGRRRRLHHCHCRHCHCDRRRHCHCHWCRRLWSCSPYCKTAIAAAAAPVSLINIKPRHWRPVDSDGMYVRGWGESGLITAPMFLSLSCYLVCVCFPFFPPSLNDSIRARTLIIGIYGIRLLYPLDTIRTRFFSPFFPLYLSPKSL